jgi:hypothetical protein
MSPAITISKTGDDANSKNGKEMVSDIMVSIVLFVISDCCYIREPRYAIGRKVEVFYCGLLAN